MRGGSVSDSVSTRLSAIQVANTAELHRLWQEAFPQSAAPNLRKEMLRAALAHRIQEQVDGSHSSDLRARLGRLAISIEAAPHAWAPVASTVKPGTRLLRRWKGHDHLVTVEHDGFEYRGDRFESLSQI